jgi:uncharacterized protein YwgA
MNSPELKQAFSMDMDSAVLAYSVLKKLGAGKVSSFDERLKSQKIQYLAQVFKVSPVYPFSLYIHGPYSPGLAKDLFAMNKHKIEPDPSDFLPDILNERFNQLSKFIQGKDNRWLELVSTLHLFIKRLNMSETAALGKVKKMKKALDEELRYSLEAVTLIP